MEALLGMAVTLIVLGGLGFARYQEVVWPEDGRGNAALAFAAGVGGILHRAFGLAPVHGTVFGILLLEGFLVTTVDTIVRLMRYLMEELWRTLWREPPRVLRSRLLNTLLPVLPVALLAFTAGYKLIWPVFGSANQLLAALTLTTAAVWLYRRGRRWAFAALPALFMVATTLTSLALLLVRHLRGASHALVAADALLLLLAAGFVWIAARTLRRAGARRRNAPLPQPSPPAEP